MSSNAKKFTGKIAFVTGASRGHPTVSELIPTMLSELRSIEEREKRDAK